MLSNAHAFQLAPCRLKELSALKTSSGPQQQTGGSALEGLRDLTRGATVAEVPLASPLTASGARAGGCVA